MPIRYTKEILPLLKAAGYNTTRLRRERILSESTIQVVSTDNLSRICAMLHCQPGDILEYTEDDAG